MAKILSREELRAKYSDTLNNRHLKNISEWTETNNGTPADEKAFKERIIGNIDVFTQKIDETIKTINRK